ncbi:MAG: amidohydrolase family protein [Gemmataceae bacterium]|nr:amidohydrolase family protein [Gemmataceae bacterium]
MPTEPRNYSARYVFPAAGPPLAGGSVTVRGDRILSVDPAGARPPDEYFGNAAIIPGLVNAHTHLDLSGARGLIPPTDPHHFTDWLRGVIAYRRTRSPEQVQADIRAGLAECLRAGTTLIGDIASEGASWDTVIASPTRAVVFLEIIGLQGWRGEEFKFAMHYWGRWHSGRAMCRPGLSPHAPYSVADSFIRMSSGFELPITIHWAETPAEMELIASRSGPFVDFLRGVGVWDEAELVPSHRQLLASIGLHAPRAILAHANYQPTDAMWRPGLTVAYCPRTHAAFDHPPHPFREFLARGVRVCLGTDSLASNPDLDVLAEARFVHAKYPDFPGDVLLKMVTLAGAEALGWADEAGSLEPGKSADLVVVPLPDRDAADPHELLFAEHPGERRALFRGVWR